MARRKGRGVRRGKRPGPQLRQTGQPAQRPAPRPAPARAALPSLLDDEPTLDDPFPDLRPTVTRTLGDVVETRRLRLEDEVVILVNDRRRAAGLAPLRVDERLRASSRAHSKDMYARGFFAHETPEGVRPADRMRTAGYPAPAAENIARGQQNAPAVVRAWMNSPGHRANILRKGLVTIGVGVFLAHGGPWWTQNFGYEA
ncbi:CAP domain-containing protein [Streptomyces sp. NPDC048629]|uniref:CAP domain-containing protein n=1 Tax=Streptomyces sp. NPDC048629 TaxID=3154824 RepID=UPI00344814F1